MDEGGMQGGARGERGFVLGGLFGHEPGQGTPPDSWPAPADCCYEAARNFAPAAVSLTLAAALTILLNSYYTSDRAHKYTCTHKYTRTRSHEHAHEP